MNTMTVGFAFFRIIVVLCIIGYFSMNLLASDQRTIAVWLFDEQEGLYPSKVLHDFGGKEYIMVLGRAGYIVPGKFGNALDVAEPRFIDFPREEDLPEKIGLEHYDIPPGRTIEPMNWRNALFAALMTSGEDQMRKEVGFVQATKTGLNLGSFHWTVEFWLQPVRESDEEGVIFEIGEGPRGENEKITRLSLNANKTGFILRNAPGGILLDIPSSRDALDYTIGEWSHFAFVYSADEHQIRHYVNGKLQPLPDKSVIKELQLGDEDYFCLGTDGVWGRSLPGRIDEIRFSHGMIYTNDFTPPGSFADIYIGEQPSYLQKRGLPLLFTVDKKNEPVVELGDRKYLFVDDAIIDEKSNITFTVNPPRVAEEVLSAGRDFGGFRKHLDVLEDEDGNIRIYNALADDYLGVWISNDGINFTAYDTGIHHKGLKNIVIPHPVGTGATFYDENAPPEHRWKHVTGYRRRGTYLFTSPDGFHFTLHTQALLPFRTATQPDVYYDDQRQKYIAYWRTGFPRTIGNQTQREFVLWEGERILPPLPYTPVTAEQTHEVAKTKRLSTVIPWYMDNGPLTPGKFGIEFPTVFGPDDDFDPPSAGVYNPKAEKYKWAPDTYLAFPVFYFHYYEAPAGRQFHIAERGGGPTETQFAVSRDGINWKRYPRPTYVGIGRFDGLDIVQNFIAKGMIRRGEEIWQYVFLDADYHSASQERTRERRVYRLVQRFDGFVSADAPYEKYGTIVTRPIRFEGNRLVLNIDTDAHGYAIVALYDVHGEPIPGYSFEESVFINGDFIETEVEWLQMGTDVSGLRGNEIRVLIKMRGAKLYSMQFIP